MGKYRTYKNGITGHKYKGYYIVKGEKKGLYQILNEDKSVFQDNILNYDECEWIIDKTTATESDRKLIELLYEKEIYQLSSLFIELMQKKEREGLDQREMNLYEWTEKVRKRKVKNKKF